jgi:2-methylaconitate cis-trans-isomerase PrpF
MTLILDKFGRQIDGLGAGISTLSKVCIVSPSSHPSADVDYTFAAVGISSSNVDFSGNCGNISAAIGPFAYNHGLVPRATQPDVTVRIHNTNTSKTIHSTFLVTDDGKEAATAGDCAIAGVPGTGAEIKLLFLDPAGSKTGSLLPTGNAIDKLDGMEASCVDAANPCVFIRAADLGITGTEFPDGMSENQPLLQRLEELRRLAAHSMRLCPRPQNATGHVPKIIIVSKPARHKLSSGEILEPNDVDIVARVMSDGKPHHTIPLTVALCIGIAATVKGTLVEGLLAPELVRDGVLTIGHPSGAIEVAVEKDGRGNVRAVNVLRTARPVMEGMVYY